MIEQPQADEELEFEEDVEVCPYCGHERGNKFQCCGEVHWIKQSEMENENAKS